MRVGGCFLFALILAVFVGTWGTSYVTLNTLEAAQQATSGQRTLEVAGMVGCAARACHGGLIGPEETTSTANSFTRWIQRDRHAIAYESLQSELSARIMKNLRSPLSATEDIRCLACHTTPALADVSGLSSADQARALKLRTQGVSCEGCHGNAKDWLGPHTTFSAPTDTPQPRRPLYDSKGMVWMNSLNDRAQSCVGCHVGSLTANPPQEVNHDMIAAGHPRLSFEFHSYLKNMPPHWREQDRSQTGPTTPRDADSALREWQVGQQVCATATLDLLQQRAQRAITHPDSAPWPELAEYDCFACHHDLRPKSWREVAGPDAGRRVGEAPWNRWAWSLPVRTWTETQAPYNRLTKAMAHGYPAPKKVIAAAQELSLAVQSRIPLPAPLTDATLNAMTWDDAAQLYLAFSALRDAKSSEIDAERLVDVRQKLEWVQQSTRANSPIDYRVEKGFPTPAALFAPLWRGK